MKAGKRNYPGGGLFEGFMIGGKSGDSFTADHLPPRAVRRRAGSGCPDLPKRFALPSNALSAEAIEPTPTMYAWSR